MLRAQIRLILGLAYPSAYIDPTTGGMLIQLLFGGSAMLLIAIKLLKTRVRSILHLGRRLNDGTN